MFGVFVHYDLRKTRHNNLFHQQTVGFEWFKNDMEVRANLYLPQGNDKVINSGTNVVLNVDPNSDVLTLAAIKSSKLERPVGGLDLEFGKEILGLDDRLYTYLAYYSFGANDKDVKTIHGFRSRTTFEIDKTKNWTVACKCITARYM